MTWWLNCGSKALTTRLSLAALTAFGFSMVETVSIMLHLYRKVGGVLVRATARMFQLSSGIGLQVSDTLVCRKIGLGTVSIFTQGKTMEE